MPGYGRRYVVFPESANLRPTLAELKTDRLQWARVIFDLFQPSAEDTPEIASLAFAALDHWDSSTTDEKDDMTTPAIVGAFFGVYYFIVANPETAFMTCRRMGKYFQSNNINVAFLAVRHFAQSPFSRYTLFVSDMLITIASSDMLAKSPVPMSLRGLAFSALFKLDPQYKFWPQLRMARDECVHGLLSWGGGSEANRKIARQILRYTGSPT